MTEEEFLEYWNRSSTYPERIMRGATQVEGKLGELASNAEAAIGEYEAYLDKIGFEFG